MISIGLGPTGGIFATGSGDQKARIWRVSKALPAAPPAPPEKVMSLPVIPKENNAE